MHYKANSIEEFVIVTHSSTLFTSLSNKTLEWISVAIMVDRGTQLDIVVVVFTVLATVAVAARFWVRIRILKRFQVDDWLIALTLV